jgi:predicted RNA-binding protein YlqC (UPF0109 family)
LEFADEAKRTVATGWTGASVEVGAGSFLAVWYGWRDGTLPRCGQQQLKAAQEQNVKFVRLWFSDILGFLKSFAILVDDLEEALEEGVAFDLEERNLGTCAVAAPVRDQMGRVIGKKGRVANAIRTLLRVAAEREGSQVTLDVVEP